MGGKYQIVVAILFYVTIILWMPAAHTGHL